MAWSSFFVWCKINTPLRKMDSKPLDPAMLKQMRKVCGQSNIGMRFKRAKLVAKEIGISYATILNALHEKPIHWRTQYKIGKWLSANSKRIAEASTPEWRRKHKKVKKNLSQPRSYEEIRDNGPLAVHIRFTPDSEILNRDGHLYETGRYVKWIDTSPPLPGPDA